MNKEIDYLVKETPDQEELAGVLTAISVVLKRLVKNIKDNPSEEFKKNEKKGDE